MLLSITAHKGRLRFGTKECIFQASGVKKGRDFTR